LGHWQVTCDDQHLAVGTCRGERTTTSSRSPMWLPCPREPSDADQSIGTSLAGRSIDPGVGEI
jgi:hypothetical protein